LQSRIIKIIYFINGLSNARAFSRLSTAVRTSSYCRALIEKRQCFWAASKIDESTVTSTGARLIRVSLGGGLTSKGLSAGFGEMGALGEGEPIALFVTLSLGLNCGIAGLSASFDGSLGGPATGVLPSLMAFAISAAFHFAYLIFSSVFPESHLRQRRLWVAARNIRTSLSRSPKTFKTSKNIEAAKNVRAVFL
jgi:hypothetical protein